MALTLDAYRPFDAGAGANIGESGWRAMARHWHRSGVLTTDVPEASLMQQLEVFGDSSGMQVKVRAGEVWIRGHHGESTAQKTLPIAANSSGSSRPDRIVARVNFVANIIEVDVVQGTGGAGAPPALVQDATQWEIPLAAVWVPNNAVTIAATDVFDERSMDRGTFTPGIIGFSSLGSSTRAGFFEKREFWAHVEMDLILAGAFTSNARAALSVYGSTASAAPGPLRPATRYLDTYPVGRAHCWDASAVRGYTGTVIRALSGLGTEWFYFDWDEGTNANGFPTPIAAAAGDRIHASLNYQTAVT